MTETVTETNDKPLLLIDVDGPLNPMSMSNRAAVRAGFRAYKTNPLTQDGRYWKDVFGDYLKVHLKREHGEQLLALSDVFELVWATTWEHDANTFIGPRIGLPELPVVEFTKLLQQFPEPPEPGLHWKTAVITAYARVRDRPFAWVDDEMRGVDGVYFARWHMHPFLAKWIDPAVGLVEKDFRELRQWAEEEMYDDSE